MNQGSPVRHVKLRAEGLGKRFPKPGAPKETIEAFRDVSFEVREGEFISIVGPSGCGKTTLLRILSGLEQHTEGRLFVRNGGSSEGAPANAIVFQQQSIYPWMTVEENITYGLRMRKMSKEIIAGRAEEFLEKTKLTAFRSAYPAQLSGGMKQRVAIARAFAYDPDVLFMDEPLSALDEQTKLILQDELLRIWAASGKTVVYVTHSLDESLALSDRVLVMTSSHPGYLKSEYVVPFARPREILELRKHEEYGDLILNLWNDIGAATGERSADNDSARSDEDSSNQE